MDNRASKTKEVLDKLIKLTKLKLEHLEKPCTENPIPLTLGNNIAPVDWYYSLFTVDELHSALENHDSSFPTKVFLVFEEMESITLGKASKKKLVRFEVVVKESVDACISEVLRQA
jgi:hypothetical protein